jgi:hypothetical protein
MMLQQAAETYVANFGGTIPAAKTQIKRSLLSVRANADHARPLLMAAWGTPQNAEQEALQAAWVQQHMDLFLALLDRTGEQS